MAYENIGLVIKLAQSSLETLAHTCACQGKAVKSLKISKCAKRMKFLKFAFCLQFAHIFLQLN
jgi:hypothetical protein